MHIDELIARERVRDTVAAYTHAGDRARLDDLAACFTEDGVLEIKGQRSAQGREAIVRMLGQNAVGDGVDRRSGGRFFIRHFVTNLRFDRITPERIESSAYFLVFTGAGPDHWGRYRDVLVPEGDRWLFAHRIAAVDTVADGSWFATR